MKKRDFIINELMVPEDTNLFEKYGNWMIMIH